MVAYSVQCACIVSAVTRGGSALEPVCLCVKFHRFRSDLPPCFSFRAAASGPGIENAPPQARRPKGRTSTAPIHRLKLSGSGCRPPPERLRRWATRPAVRRTAETELHSSPPCLHSPPPARSGAKTGYGFRAGRTSTAQSTAQFSDPCTPHCGSAFAPPRFRAPGEILSKRASTF